MRRLIVLPIIALLTAGMAKCDATLEDEALPYRQCEHLSSGKEITFDAREIEVFWSLDGYTVSAKDINTNKHYSINFSSGNWSCSQIAAIAKAKGEEQ